MDAPISPAALEALAHEYDELGIEVELVRTSLGVPSELEYRMYAGRWKTIFASSALIQEEEEAARYRQVVDLEAEAALRA